MEYKKDRKNEDARFERFLRENLHVTLDLAALFAEGHCSEAEARWVESHIAKCAKCRDEVESVRNARRESTERERKALDDLARRLRGVSFTLEPLEDDGVVRMAAGTTRGRTKEEESSAPPGEDHRALPTDLHEAPFRFGEAYHDREIVMLTNNESEVFLFVSGELPEEHRPTVFWMENDRFVIERSDRQVEAGELFRVTDLKIQQLQGPDVNVFIE